MTPSTKEVTDRVIDRRILDEIARRVAEVAHPDKAGTIIGPALQGRREMYAA
jgi:hypothetical protein